MSENKKYYYMKLKENFFTSERMVVLEMMPDGILYSNLLLKMYLMSLKNNGILLLHENLPHTPQTIATFTRHQIGTVERALQIFLKLGFVELLTDGAYYMPDRVDYPPIRLSCFGIISVSVRQFSPVSFLP